MRPRSCAEGQGPRCETGWRDRPRQHRSHAGHSPRRPQAWWRDRPPQHPSHAGQSQASSGLAATTTGRVPDYSSHSVQLCPFGPVSPCPHSHPDDHLLLLVSMAPPLVGSHTHMSSCSFSLCLAYPINTLCSRPILVVTNGRASF